MLYQRHAAGWTQFTGEVIGTSWSYYNTPEQNLAAKYPRLSDMTIDGSSGNNSQVAQRGHTVRLSHRQANPRNRLHQDI